MTQKVYVVGLGPGGIEQMTQRAKAAFGKVVMLLQVIMYISILLKMILQARNF